MKLSLWLADDVEEEVVISKDRYVALLKAKAQEVFPELCLGKMLHCVFEQTLLSDEKFLGEYSFLEEGAKVHIIIPEHQPYARVDYEKLAKALESDTSGRKKSLKDFFDPKKDDNEWDPEWKKGDEYLRYPPVDVNNIWSSVDPKTSGQIIKPIKLNSFFKSIGATGTASSRGAGTRGERSGRFFKSAYVCKVGHYSFSVIHLMEGRWSGLASYFPGTKNACSSNLVFDSQSSCWVERQVFADENGIAISRIFRYVPIGNGECEVHVEGSSSSLSEAKLYLSEVQDGVLTLVGKNQTTGKNLFIETITMSHGETERRLRTITRFDNEGNFSGLLVCNEKRVIDEDTGALEPFM